MRKDIEKKAAVGAAASERVIRTRSAGITRRTALPRSLSSCTGVTVMNWRTINQSAAAKGCFNRAARSAL